MRGLAAGVLAPVLVALTVAARGGGSSSGELLRKQGEELSKYGGKLTALPTKLHC